MKTNITRPMIIALADLLNGAVAIRGPEMTEAQWINPVTQRSLTERSLARIRVGEQLLGSVPVARIDMRVPTGMSAWLEVTPAGQLVVSGYILGVETAEENAAL